MIDTAECSAMSSRRCLTSSNVHGELSLLALVGPRSIPPGQYMQTCARRAKPGLGMLVQVYRLPLLYRRTMQRPLEVSRGGRYAHMRERMGEYEKNICLESQSCGKLAACASPTPTSCDRFLVATSHHGTSDTLENQRHASLSRN